MAATEDDYTKLKRQAIDKLRLAITYVEDGAPLDGARCAVTAADILFKAARYRNELMGRVEEVKHNG